MLCNLNCPVNHIAPRVSVAVSAPSNTCKLSECTQPTTTGYVFNVPANAVKAKIGFNVTGITCGPGYTGIASVAVCNQYGGNYIVSGCTLAAITTTATAAPSTSVTTTTSAVVPSSSSNTTLSYIAFTEKPGNDKPVLGTTTAAAAAASATTTKLNDRRSRSVNKLHEDDELSPCSTNVLSTISLTISCLVFGKIVCMNIN